MNSEEELDIDDDADALDSYESDTSDSELDLDNLYHSSKDRMQDEPRKALEGFQKILVLEGENRSVWGFKALKQMVKINFQQDEYDEMMAHYKTLLTYIKNVVSWNVCEKSISELLEYISTSNPVVMERFYEMTLSALKKASNDRVWFKTNIKLGKLYYDGENWGRLQTVIRQLRKSCQLGDGEDDMKKGTQLLEIYALEIQMYTAQKNNKKLKALYEQSLRIKSGVPRPLIMGVIRECGGKMHLHDGNYEKALNDFFEAFKSYDEACSPRRTTCLKYLVLANMLTKSGINPFDSQEARPHKNTPEIMAMTNLVSAYQNNDITEFEKILKANRQSIMDDPFIREHIEDLLRNVRTQVLIQLIKPYTRIHISFVAQELNIAEAEVEELLVSCILDNTIPGRIDQVRRLLELNKESACTGRYSAIEKWSLQTRSLHESIINLVV